MNEKEAETLHDQAKESGKRISNYEEAKQVVAEWLVENDLVEEDELPMCWPGDLVRKVAAVIDRERPMRNKNPLVPGAPIPPRRFKCSICEEIVEKRHVLASPECPNAIRPYAIPKGHKHHPGDMIEVR